MSGFQRLGPHLQLAAINKVLSSELLTGRWRALLLRSLGISIRRSEIRPGSRLVNGLELRIGSGCFINACAVFDATYGITVKDNVFVGPGVAFITSSHALNLGSEVISRAGAVTGAGIVLGDGCWIGAGAVILPGADVGARSVVAAGAVVRTPCEADALYAGVPAKLIRHF